MTTVTFTIPNISCGHCVHTIESELSELDGVETVVADLTTKQVNITFDAPASEDAIRELLISINYPAVN